MAIDKLQRFRNVTYDYKDDDDVFIARGLHLNMLNDTLSMVIDEVNAGSSVTGNQYEIPVSNAAGDGFDFSEGFKVTDGGLDQYGVYIKVGGDAGVYTSRTDATGKAGGVVVPHYTNAEEDFAVVLAATTASSNVIFYGGASPDLNTATRHAFYAAANTTTTTGTLIAEITTSGLFVDTISELTASAGVTINNAVTMPNLASDDTEDHVIAINDTTGLLTKRSVASIGGGAYTFENGITESTGTVTLGGILTALTTIDASNQDFRIRTTNSTTRSNELLVAEGNIMLSAYLTTDWTNTDAYGRFQATTGFVTMSWKTTGGANEFKAIEFDATEMEVRDDVDSKGFVYRADYSTAGVADDRWIPDYGAVKAYADSVSGTPYPAGSGIPIVVSGTSWGTTITDNSTNWDSAYSHISLTNNPHSVDETDVLPSQGGHSGEFLTTNGTVTSWVAGGGGGTVTNVTSSTTSQLTVANGTTTPALTIVTAAVINTGTALATGDQIYDFVTGFGYSTTVGTVTQIIASTTPVDGLSLSGGTITGSGTIALSGNINVTAVTGTLPVSNGGTGLATIGTSRILTGNGTAALTAEANLTFNGSTLAVTGAITATGEITAYSSDRRLKTEIAIIPDALAQVKILEGVHYKWRKDVCAKVGFTPARDWETGMIAQNVASVIRDATGPAPFDTDYEGNSISGENYLTVKLERIVPLLVEAIKELSAEVERLKK